MTTAIYLEHYLESLESLPVELQRNFTLMRDLDSRAQDVMQKIDGIRDEYMKTVSTSTKEKKREHHKELNKLFSKAKEYADDKVQLATQTYELVDKHIRRFDSDLAKFESEIKNGTVTIGPPGSHVSILSPRAGLIIAHDPKEKSAEPPIASEKATKKGRKREKETAIIKKPKTKVEVEEKHAKVGGGGGGGGAGAKGSTSPGTVGASRKKHKSELQIVAEQVASALASSGEVFDMPVDPNEPTYCICHQVSFGQMIACDNPDCPIEWFHIGCMGLCSIPKGKWFCPKCNVARLKK